MNNPQAEPPDYYLNEQGYMVFTARHHLNRGYCCGMGCRHCPYQWEAVPEPKRSLLLEEQEQQP